MKRQSDHVAIVEPAADLVSPFGERHRGLTIAAVLGEGRLAERQETVLHARLVIVQMPLRPHQPPHRDRRVAAFDMVEAQQHRVERSLGIFAGGSEARVRALACGDRFVPSRQPPRRIRQPFEVPRAQPSGIRAVQRVEGLGPGVPREGIPGSVDVGRSLGHVRVSSGSPPRSTMASRQLRAREEGRVSVGYRPGARSAKGEAAWRLSNTDGSRRSMIS